MKKTTTKNNILFSAEVLLSVIAVSLLLLDRYTPVYINNTIVHFLVFYIAVTALAIAALVFVFRIKSARSILVVMFLTLSVCFAVAFLTWGGDWKTQTVIYRDVKDRNRTIEFRIRGDRFAFGYKEQIVIRKKILPFADIINAVDTSRVDISQWKRVDQRLNEMKIPEENIDLP